MSPPAPLVDWPVTSEMPPLSPAQEVPVCTSTRPLTPPGPTEYEGRSRAPECRRGWRRRRRKLLPLLPLPWAPTAMSSGRA